MEETEKIVVELEGITEQTYDILGANIKYILSRMFAGGPINATVKGPSNKVHAFYDTIKRERDFLAQAKRLGLDNPSTYRNKAKLDTSVKNFERETGLKWPLK